MTVSVVRQVLQFKRLNSLKQLVLKFKKGMHIEERKIQRSFPYREVTRSIKKSNDFGAGGVCVAIGELADILKLI